MASEFGACTADFVTIANAASLSNHAVRLGELTTLLSGKSDVGHTHAQLHDALTIVDGATVNLTLTVQQLTAEVIRGTNSALKVVSDGLAVDLGTAANQAAAGNHTHAQLHDAITVSNPSGRSVTLTLAAQQISAAVALGTNSGLLATSGIVCDFGTGANQVARGNHTHANATTSVAGFMSATDKTKLDGLGSGSGYVTSVANTASITLAVSGGGALTAALKLGEGLILDTVNGEVDVDASLFAAASHTHANATTSAAGFMSAADKIRLDGLSSGGGSVSIIDTDTVHLVLNSGVLHADVRMKTGGAILNDSDGIYVKLGTGSTDAAAGNHTHSQLHDAVTVSNVSTRSVTLSLAAQQISAAVALGTNSGLLTTSGLTCDFGTGANQVARGNHTHAAATTSVDGFLSAADKTKLDSLATQAGIVLSVANTKTISLAVSGGGQLTANVKPGPGLKEGTSDLLEVDFSAVAPLVHSHSNATTSVAGFMSAADKTKLDASLNTSGNDARYLLLTGATAMTGGLTLAALPVNAMHATSKSYVDGLFDFTIKNDRTNDLNSTNNFPNFEIAGINQDGTTTYFHVDGFSGGIAGSTGRAGATASGIGGFDGDDNPSMISRIGATEILTHKTLRDPVFTGTVTFPSALTVTDWTLEDPTIKFMDLIELIADTFDPLTSGGQPLYIHRLAGSTLGGEPFDSADFNFGHYDSESSGTWGHNDSTVIRYGDLTGLKNVASGVVGIGSDLSVSLPGSLTIAGITTHSFLTASRVAILDASKNLTHSSVTTTELGYLSGVTSAVQTQLAAKLTAAGNLSDVLSASTARTNLGLGTAATQSTGTFAQVANNLSDLASATTARTNLGLGNVENKSSATIRGEITSSNVTTALTFTPENAANKSTTTSLGTSNTLYPTQNAVKSYVDTNAELVSNKSTNTSLGASNTLYPSQNAVKTYVDNSALSALSADTAEGLIAFAIGFQLVETVVPMTDGPLDLSNSQPFLKLEDASGGPPTTTIDVRSLAYPSGGRVVTIHNDTSFTVNLVHESGSGTAENRFHLPGATDLPIAVGSSATLIYCGNIARWRLIAST